MNATLNKNKTKGKSWTFSKLGKATGIKGDISKLNKEIADINKLNISNAKLISKFN